MANLGVPELRIVDPVCQINTSESRKFAHHARPILLGAKVYGTLPDAVADRGLVVGVSARRRLRGRMPSWTPALARSEIGASAGSLALVFGNELNGLSNEELECCHACIRLSTPGDYPSYNLSHAIAITLYELCADRSERSSGHLPLASQRDLQRLLDVWLDTLDEIGYFRRTSRQRYAPKLRRMLGRWRMALGDVNALSGMMGQIRDRAGR